MRRRNLIQPDEFPYEVGVGWQDGNRAVYDSGNFPGLLEKALANLGPRPAGHHIGLGLGMYVEGTGVGPYEGAHVQVLVSGKVVASTAIHRSPNAWLVVTSVIAARNSSRQAVNVASGALSKSTNVNGPIPNH